MVWDRKIRSYPEQMEALWSIVQASTGDPAVVDLVAQLVRDNEIASHDETAVAKALQEWVIANVRFFREHPERWQSGARTIAWKIGDCDDQSILVCSALRSLRIPCRMKFVRFLHPKTGQRKSHVYSQAKLGGDWVSIETVRPFPFGYDPEEKMKSQGIQVTAVEYVGDK